MERDFNFRFARPFQSNHQVTTAPSIAFVDLHINGSTVVVACCAHCKAAVAYQQATRWEMGFPCIMSKRALPAKEHDKVKCFIKFSPQRQVQGAYVKTEQARLWKFYRKSFEKCTWVIFLFILIILHGKTFIKDW